VPEPFGARGRTAATSSLRDRAHARILASETTPSWRIAAAEALGIWLATRVILLLVTYFTGVVNSHDSPHTAHGYVVGTQTAGQLLGNWVRWDAEWYIKISRLGYFSDQATAFFPLYPLLIAGLTALAGDFYRAGIAMLIANLFSLAAFVGVGLLAAHELGAAHAARAVLVLAAYPLAIFLAAPYTEALFVTFAVFTLLWARQGRWKLAASSRCWSSSAASTAGWPGCEPEGRR
jgi:Gpi18-like mannosyltransferase